MLKTVEPHDIHFACREADITIKDLSERTGISQETLILFAGGIRGLSALDRFAIISTLHEASQWYKPPPDESDTEVDKAMRRVAYTKLLEECDEELREPEQTTCCQHVECDEFK